MKSEIKYNEYDIKKKDKLNWACYCATTINRNQCSEVNCIIYPICLIKNISKEKKDEN